MFQRRFLTNIIYPNITITSNAWNKLDDIIKKGDITNNRSKLVKGFLFSAKSGGCNGFNYNLNSFNKRDYKTYFNKYSKNVPVTVISNNNINVMVEPFSEPFLLGTTIDYITADYINNNYESKFVFTPNSALATSCGCGKSFTVKD